MIVLAAGTIGTTQVLLNTAKKTPAVHNPLIGKGLILHPSLPLVGAFDRQINLLQGLDSATFVDAFGVTPGFIFETMGGLPAYGAVLVPGSGRQVYKILSQFNLSAGFGVMLVDTVSDGNCVALDRTGNVVVTYALSEADKQRFRTGAALAVRMMFLAGAKKVIIPSNENFLRAIEFRSDARRVSDGHQAGRPGGAQSGVHTQPHASHGRAPASDKQDRPKSRP